jgi:hypothetical protein
LAVDGGRFEPDGFGNPQAGRIADRQDDPVLQVLCCIQESGDLLLAQHDGQLFCLVAGGDIVLDDPGPLQGDGVEEPERRDGDDDRAGREAPFLGQVDQIGPDLRWPEEIGGLAEWQAKRTRWAT